MKTQFYFVGRTIDPINPDTAEGMKHHGKQPGHIFRVSSPELVSRSFEHFAKIAAPSESPQQAMERLATKLSGKRSVGTPPDRSSGGNETAAMDTAMAKLRAVNSKPVPKWNGYSNTVFRNS